MTDDATFLTMALAEGWKSAGQTRPNPPVGAVVVKGGVVIGRGRHRRCGGDHAEVAALKDCRVSPAGSTVYVTLEPCSRPGRVGACTDALIAAGVRRVVWAAADPNPVNAGRARRVLSRAGILAERFRGPQPAVGAPPFGGTALDLIAPFARHVRTGLPFVTVKIALSLDGRICDDAGAARWISSADSRRRTGRLRERVDAVLVGGETVRRDDPSLLCHTRRRDNLLRAVVSRSGDIPATARILTDAARDRTFVYASPRAALEDLGRRGCLHVLCEGGLNLARSLAAEDLVDAWLTVLSPVVIGARPLAGATRYPARDAFFYVPARPVGKGRHALL